MEINLEKKGDNLKKKSIKAIFDDLIDSLIHKSEKLLEKDRFYCRTKNIVEIAEEIRKDLIHFREVVECLHDMNNLVDEQERKIECINDVEEGKKDIRSAKKIKIWFKFV